MTIVLMDNLINSLNIENLRYCHWKSNYSLAESFSGKTDLDLLIDRKSLSSILVILLDMGFKPAGPKSGLDPDGIFHYYGMDATTGQLIHVHLFSNILTGESFIKTHLLPFENMLLENTDTIGEIKVASRPAELVTFVVRTFIKYGSLLDVLGLIGKEELIRNEIIWLQNGMELKESLELLNKYCPVISDGLFLQCIHVLRENTSILKRILLAWSVRGRLIIYAKFHPIGLAGAYCQFIWRKAESLLERRKKNKVLKTGGAVIAFVGAEATGKSTLVTEIRNWLNQIISTRTVHAGKPPSTWMTGPINLLVPLIRSLFPQLRTTRQDGRTVMKVEPVAHNKKVGLSSLIYALRCVSLAWDRRQLLVHARFHASNGDIVICDRYPSENIGTMDSPRLEEYFDLKGVMAVFYNMLTRMEQRFYKEIPPPDLVLKLKVSMEVAIQRNRNRIKRDKETDAYLEDRHRQSREWCKAGTKYIFEINTDQSIGNTIMDVKRKIWEVL